MSSSSLECRPHRWSAEKPANTPVTSLVANHVHFNVLNPMADSTAWSMNTKKPSEDYEREEREDYEYDSRH